VDLHHTASDRPDTVPIPFRECDANTTCILDSRICRDKIHDRINPILRNTAGTNVRTEFNKITKFNLRSNHTREIEEKKQ
jgi:hypothetical protein